MLKNLIRIGAILGGFITAIACFYLWKRSTPQIEEDPFFFYGDSLYREGQGVTVHYEKDDDSSHDEETEISVETAEQISSMVH